MDKLNLMASFIAVVEQGSYTAAGRYLGKTKALISKHIHQLEIILDARLLNRSTRSLHLTDPGRLYYEQAKRILDDVATLETKIRQDQRQLAGRLRVSVPMTYAEEVLIPVFAALIDAHPQLKLELDIRDRYVDLINEGFDAAIRIGRLDDSSLIAAPIDQINFQACVSPKFIARYGLPKSVQQLTQLPCILDRNYRSGDLWYFRGQQAVKVNAATSVSNAAAAVRLAAASSMVTFSPDFAVASYIKQGALIPIFADVAPQPSPVHVVYPHREYLENKVSYLISHLRQSLGYMTAQAR